jgi:hypothetical protein
MSVPADFACELVKMTLANPGATMDGVGGPYNKRQVNQLQDKRNRR